MKLAKITFFSLFLSDCAKYLKKIYLPTLMIFLFQSQILAQEGGIKPVERNVGKLQISIDPRMELLSTIQLLSNYSFIDRDVTYSKNIIKHFKSFKTQEAVKMTNALQKEYGFSYDAPVEFMLCLSHPLELKQNTTFSNYLIERVGSENNLEQYRKSMKEFFKNANFGKFWNKNISFYNQILDMTIADMGKKDLVKAMEDYYNETKESYNIVISPAFKGNYGPQITDSLGKDNIYACLSTNAEKESVPYLNHNGIMGLVWHEFGHSFVNPLSEKYTERIKTSEQLFEPIRNRMTELAYSEWETCVNEHIVRAVHIRLYESNSDEEKAKKALEYEFRDGFIYIEPIIEKLKEFEKQRDEKNITFSEFYPELLNLLDSLQKIEYWKNVIGIFKGSICTVSNAEKIVYIYPTYDKDKKSLKIVQNYALKVFKWLDQSKGALWMADTTALKTDLADYGIYAFGTIESNLFLKQFIASFPFRIENKTLYANKKYTEKNIKLITCVPNPFNSERGMIIYTALSNKFVKGNAGVFRLRNDYILLRKNAIIEYGVYNKNDKWEF